MFCFLRSKKLFNLLFLTLAFIIMPKSVIYAQSHDQFKHAIKFLNTYRGLLNRTQDESVADILRRTKEYGFKYLKGNDASLRKITDDTDFSISFSEGRYYVTWTNGGITIVECQFPANYGMLTFSNKIDMENQLIERLAAASRQVIETDCPVSRKADLQHVPLSNFYLSDNGFYITPRLKNQIIYEPAPDDTASCRLLIDSGKYQLESLANMMLTGYSPVPLNISLKVNQYGYKHSDIEISLPGLFQLLSEEGSAPYWGVDTFDGTDVKGVYVWVNTYGGYAHLLSVNIPIDAVSTSFNPTAKLHCYLRLDNLKSLFEEYDSL